MPEGLIYQVQIASTLSVLLPIAAFAWHIRRLDQPFRAFLFFLFVGLITDLLGWYFGITGNVKYNLIARHAYDLFEGLFLTWMIGQFVTRPALKTMFLWLLPIVVLFWAGRFLYDGLMSMFKSGTQLFFASATCVLILQMTERYARPWQTLAFWIMCGIFFYCFSTFFLMAFLNTQLSRIWLIHNAINILTNLIYFIGLLKAIAAGRRSSSASF